MINGKIAQEIIGSPGMCPGRQRRKFFFLLQVSVKKLEQPAAIIVYTEFVRKRIHSVICRCEQFFFRDKGVVCLHCSAFDRRLSGVRCRFF